MEKMPKTIISEFPKVETLSGNVALTYRDNYHEYFINRQSEEEDEVRFTTPKYESYMGKSTDTIVAEEDFVNGFKVVTLENGQFGYVRESDNVLLPNRYDIAFNFNQYGLAMVGRRNGVTWIDKNFNYQSIPFEEMVEDEVEDEYSLWQTIYDFSEGKTPLSLMEINGSREYREEIGGYYDRSKCAYLTTDGTKMKFRKVDEDGVEDYYYATKFSYGQPFRKNGITKAISTMYGENNNYILIDEGYYINVDTFVDLLEKQPSEDSNIRVGINIK